MTDSLQEKINQLPQTPGTYLFTNGSGEVIYVGKAGNLRSRVRSYFQNNQETHNSAKRAMIAEIADVTVYECQSEVEALILESQLIKKYDTKYNILLRDDKSYAYVAFTKEDFPRMFVTHQAELEANPEAYDYLGPFVSADSLRQTLRILRKIFPYRSCKTMPKVPCVYYTINRCSAPCAGLIAKMEYQETLRKIKDFLKGNKQQLITELDSQMKWYAENQQFEKAAQLRDELHALKNVSLHKGVIRQSQNTSMHAVRDLQNILGLDKLPNRIEGYDSSHSHGKQAVVSMVVAENGRMKRSEYRSFKIRNAPPGGDDFFNLNQALRRRFNHREWKTPDLIVIDGGKGQLSAALEAQKQASFPEYQSIPIISLAKREEDIFVPYQEEPIFISRPSRALKLLQRVRDEAHRFAVQYHQKLHRKSHVPGPKRNR